MNIVQRQYKPRLLVSISGANDDDISFLTAFITHLRTQDVPSPPHLTVHLPAQAVASAPEDFQKTLMNIVKNEISQGSMEIWSAGYSGAPIDLLYPDEARAERMWGDTNQWGTGLSDVIGVSVNRYFPFRLTSLQARSLAAEDIPVCAGYLEPPVSGTKQPLLLTQKTERGKTWVAVRSFFIDAADIDAADIDGADIIDEMSLAPPRFSRKKQRPGDIDFIHITCGGGTNGAVNAVTVAEGVASLLRTLGEGQAGIPHSDPADAAAELRGPLRYSGIDPYPLYREPLVLALLARIRQGRNDDQSAILSASRGIGPIRSVNDETRPPLRKDWELQGGISGALTMQENQLRVHFAGGRISGISTTGNSPSLQRRAQGYLRRKTGAIVTTTYLETSFAAWFTGDRVRGVEELAVLEQIGTLKTSAVMIEGHDALLFTQEIQLTGDLPEETEDLCLYELPLCPVSSTVPTTLSCLGPDGETVVTVEIPRNHGTLSRDIILSGRSLTVSGSHGGIRITPADDGGTLLVPFHLAVIPAGDGHVLVFRTSPSLPSRSPGKLAEWPPVPWWSTSYVFRPTDAPEEHGLDGDLRRNVRGFRINSADESIRRST